MYFIDFQNVKKKQQFYNKRDLPYACLPWQKEIKHQNKKKNQLAHKMTSKKFCILMEN